MMRLIVIVLFASWSTANGWSVFPRAADGGSSINDTINVFTSLADDKNFTSVEPDTNSTESANDDKIPVEVTVEKEDEKAEKEEDKIEIKPLSPIVTEVESSPAPSQPVPSSSPTTTSTSTTTTTTPSISSSSVPIVNSPVVSSENDTDSLIDGSFNTNDTMSNEFFSSINTIMAELGETNDTTNSLDISSGGIASSNDEFSNYFEMLDKLDGLEVLFEPDQ